MDNTASVMADKSWVYVQKKTFTNWVNDKLKATDCKVEDLQVDLKDGIVLITLMQVLAPGKKMPGRCVCVTKTTRNCMQVCMQ